MSEDTTPFENRNIQGVTVKNLVWFFTGVISVIISVMLSATSIKSELRLNQVETANQIANLTHTINELNQKVVDGDSDRRTLSLQVQSLQLQVARLEEKLGLKNYK